VDPRRLPARPSADDLQPSAAGVRASSARRNRASTAAKHSRGLRFSVFAGRPIPERHALPSSGRKPPRRERGFGQPLGSVARVAAVALSINAAAACAVKTSTPGRTGDLGIPRCPPVAARDLLSADALQCWFDAPHGRWRTLSHESHYTVLVVHVAVQSLQDARDIARRFVAGKGEPFSEILVYAEPESTDGRTRTRRVRWTRDGGFEELDF